MDIETISATMRQRMLADSEHVSAMIAARDRYNGDYVTLTPDVSGIPAANRPGPNFFTEGIDDTARTSSQMMPKISCPTVNPDSVTSMKRSGIRQGALYGGWHDSQLELKLARAFRHMIAYGTCSMVVVPDPQRESAVFQLREPLTSFPELRSPDDIRDPINVGFVTARSAAWLLKMYPNCPQWVKTATSGYETMWNVVEWIDEDSIVIGIIGPRFTTSYGQYVPPVGIGNHFELGRWPNLAGVVPAVVPRRVTLDKIMGQLTGVLNLSDTYSRMLDLQMVATEKNIFPSMVVMSRTGQVPTLVGGKWKDGRTGDVNIVLDGVVEVVSQETGPGTIPMLQMIDGHIRGTGGIVSTGQIAGMRTGAGVDALGDMTTNPLAAEAQTNMKYALESLNRSFIAVQKGYYGKKKFTVHLGLPGSDKTVTYTPDIDLDSDANVVSYPMPGSDMNRLAVAVTQLVATGIISRKKAREMHPLVHSEDEQDQDIVIEKMNDAALAGLSQSIAQGATPIEVVALMAQKVAEGKPVYQAIIEAKAEAASAAPAPGTPGAPPAPTGPDGAPLPSGLAGVLAAQQGGAAAPPAQAPGSIPAENPNLQNLRHALQGINANVSPSAV